MNENNAFDEVAIRKICRKVLKASSTANEGHIPSALSIIDILYALYFILPRVSKINFIEKDKFILSKGHASLGLYGILELAGLIESDWVEEFGKFESKYGGHPDMTKLNGVHASTGSLGHGLPIAVGMALALRISGKEEHVVVLVGDGEMNEGTNWESMLFSSHNKLSNLTIIVDYNHSGDRALGLGDLKSKFESFGFQTVTIDGHNHQQIVEKLLVERQHSPLAVIASTIKGFRLQDMENQPAWHHKTPKHEELEQFLKEIE